MGIDMYLYKLDKDTDITIDDLSDLINDNEKRVAHWRRTAYINQWFFTNVYNGSDTTIPIKTTKKQLTSLVEICKHDNQREIYKNYKYNCEMNYHDCTSTNECKYTVYSDEYYVRLFTIETITKLIESTDFEKQTIWYFAV